VALAALLEEALDFFSGGEQAVIAAIVVVARVTQTARLRVERTIPPYHDAESPAPLGGS